MKKINYVLLAVMVLLPALGFAEGIDVFAGLIPSVKTSMNGGVKAIIYAAEIVAALALYIKSKNLMVLGGVGVVMVYLNFAMALI